MCEYCKPDPRNRETLYRSDYLWSGRTDCVEVGVNGNTMHVTAEVDNAGYTAEFDITFCPMCGTRLTEEGK